MDEHIDVTAQPGRRLRVGALALTALVGASGPADAATDYLLKIEGIKGESQDAKHKDEIDVLSWSWGVEPAGTDAKGKLVPACGRVLNVAKYVDLASPPLITATVLGTTIPGATLTAKNTSTSTEYLVINFTGVMVRSLNNAGASGSDRPVEQVSFGFASATFSYKPQNPDGSLGAAVSASIPAVCP